MWDISNPTQIVITEDGVYKLFFCANLALPSQFCFTVNGVPVDYSIQGINKGSTQGSTRIILKLLKNDVVTLINHTSANSSMRLTDYAGGTENTIAAILTMFKIAPHTNPTCAEPPCNKHFKKCYEQFKQYLLHRKDLNIIGSENYVAVASNDTQLIPLGQPVTFWHNNVVRNVKHIQGTPGMTIEKDGVYDLFFDALTDEPAQYSLYRNNVIEPNVIFGGDSAATRVIMRQIMEFKKGDVIEILNHSSHAGTLSGSINSGGQLVAQNFLFIAFRLCNAEPNCVPCNKQKPKTLKK